MVLFNSMMHKFNNRNDEKVLKIVFFWKLYTLHLQQPVSVEFTPIKPVVFQSLFQMSFQDQTLLYLYKKLNISNFGWNLRQ